MLTRILRHLSVHTNSTSMEPQARRKVSGPAHLGDRKRDPQHLAGRSNPGAASMASVDAANEERSENSIDMHFHVGFFVSLDSTIGRTKLIFMQYSDGKHLPYRNLLDLELPQPVSLTQDLSHVESY